MVDSLVRFLKIIVSYVHTAEFGECVHTHGSRMESCKVCVFLAGSNSAVTPVVATVVLLTFTAAAAQQDVLYDCGNPECHDCGNPECSKTQ